MCCKRSLEVRFVMTKFSLFLGSFLSYLLVFLIFVGVICIAVCIGISLRKKKDAGLALKEAASGDETALTDNSEQV